MTKEIKISNDSVFIGGVEYVTKDNQLSPNYTGDVKIVILQRGWIYIGRFSRDSKGLCKLENAFNIQNWGTTEGLGELVNGVTPKTVLKKVSGIIEFDWLTVIHTITCDKTKYPQI